MRGPFVVLSERGWAVTRVLPLAGAASVGEFGFCVGAAVTRVASGSKRRWGGCGGGLMVDGLDRRCSVHASPFQNRSNRRRLDRSTSPALVQPKSFTRLSLSDEPARSAYRGAAGRARKVLRGQDILARPTDRWPQHALLRLQDYQESPQAGQTYNGYSALAAMPTTTSLAAIGSTVRCMPSSSDPAVQWMPVAVRPGAS